MSGKHRAIQPALIWNDEIVTVPLIPSAARALHEWHHTKSAEMDEVLRPFGISTMEIAQPQYESIIPAPRKEPTHD